MARSDLRNDDERCSDIVSQFLDKHFYCGCKSFERVYDKSRQVKGSDVIFTMGSRSYNCDEKAAIRYVNKGLKTFSLELSFINTRGELTQGWLIDPTKVNDSFLFIWIDKAKHDMLTSVDDIQVMEVSLVRKVKIMEYLESIGWTQDRLARKDSKIRNNPDESLGDVYRNGCKFVFSEKLHEKPINVLLSRYTLAKISDINRVFEIKK